MIHEMKGEVKKSRLGKVEIEVEERGEVKQVKERQI